MKDDKSPGFNPSRWSIDNPYAILAFYMAVLVLSLVALGSTMPRRFMPYVESPMLGIATTQPGLSAEEMETYISKPIEERMVAIPGVRFLRSTSQDGFSIVSLEFPYGTDMKASFTSVQALLTVIAGDLPVSGANLKPSWLLPIDPLNLPILSLSLSGDARWSLAQLRELADNQVINRLKASTTDVLAVSAFGGHRRELQVIVDRNRLAARGLSITQVKEAVDHFNVARPGGTMTTGSREITVRLDTLARDARSVLDYPVLAVKDRIVLVRDVARVEDTVTELRSAFHHLQKGHLEEAIEVNVLQNPQASSPRVIAAVRQEMKQLEADYPGIHFATAYDNSRFVGVLMKNMLEELAVSVFLTGLVVWLFLGDWRGTLISIVTVPTSMAMAILGIQAMGMSLNSSTMIGLLIAVGRLVDDTIIDIHNIERHLQMGKDPRNATIDGITEVRLAVAASTLMLILALSPLLVCGGIVQLMFEGLVWPIILGLMASFLVSLTLTALLASHLMVVPERRARDRQGKIYRWLLGPIQNQLQRLEDGYTSLIGWLLQHRFVNLVRVLATVLIGFGFYYFIGSEMMPLADVGQAYAVLEMEPGTSFAATQKAVGQLETILAKYPEIENAKIELGTEPMSLPNFSGYSAGRVNGATMMLTLSDKSQRDKTIWTLMDGIVAEARSSIPGVRLFQMKGMGSDVMASSSAPISILVYGPELGMLSRLGEQVAEIAAKTPGMVQVATSWSMSNPSYQLHLDPRRLAEVGMGPDEVANQAYYSLRGGFANEFYRLPNLRQAKVLVRYEGDQRTTTPQDLEQMTIQTHKAGNVLLSSLGSWTRRATPSLIEHDNMRRVVTVNGYYRMGGAASMDLSMNVMMTALSKINWPPGYGLEIRGDMTQMSESFGRLLKGLGFSIIFILLILVAQFRGLLQPLQMVFSIPLELTGVFIALWLNHQAFSSVSIMAIIVLTGMDATTAILLIDQIMRQREQGVPRNRAIREACPTRLRPILMTSLITIAVMIPVAFFPKTGMDAYSPLGTVIIGGLLMGTALSLIDIPIMHSLVDDASRWVQVHLFKKDPASLPAIEDE